MDSKKKDVVAAYTSKPLGKERPLTPPLSTSDVEGSRIIGELCSAICPHEMVQNKVVARLGSYHTVRSCTNTCGQQSPMRQACTLGLSPGISPRRRHQSTSAPCIQTRSRIHMLLLPSQFQVPRTARQMEKQRVQLFSVVKFERSSCQQISVWALDELCYSR